jgi:hypothetical protein
MQDGFEDHIAINPALIVYENGSISVTYRGARDDGFGNCLMASWRDECIRPEKVLGNTDIVLAGCGLPFNPSSTPLTIRTPTAHCTNYTRLMPVAESV